MLSSEHKTVGDSEMVLNKPLPKGFYLFELKINDAIQIGKIIVN